MFYSCNDERISYAGRKLGRQCRAGHRRRTRHARRSSCMAARLAPRCVVGCGWRGVWALRRGRASGATAPRGPTARHHSVAPSEDVGEEYHERDQNHGADHDDQPIGAHLRIYGLGSGRGGGRRGYPRAALRWASSIRCRRWQSPRPRRSADILRAIPAAPSATHRITDRPLQCVESLPRIAPRRSTMVTSWTDDGPYAVARRTRHGCQRSRPATGASRGLNTSLSLSTLTPSGCYGLASPASHHSPRSQ